MSTTIEPSQSLPTTPLPPTRKPSRSPSTDGKPFSFPKRNRIAIVWKLALVAVGATALSYGGYHWFYQTAAQSTEITATVVRSDLPMAVTERGEIESSETVDVRCDIEGYENKVVSILPEGTQVKKDQVVVEFDQDKLKKERDDQKVKLSQAEGKSKVAEGELVVQKSTTQTATDKAKTAAILAKMDYDKYEPGDYKVALEEGKSDIELAKKDLHEAQEDLDRTKKIYSRGASSLEQVRAKELIVSQKDFALRGKIAKLDLLEKWTKKRTLTELQAKWHDAEGEAKRTEESGKAAVAKAQNDLDSAKVTERLERTALERTEKQLAKCTVKAPQDGILVYSKERWWDESNRIRAGAVIHYQQGLFSLPNLAKLQVKVKVHEAMVKKVKPGQKAEIRVDAYAGHVLMGTVKSVGTMASTEGWFDRATKQYETIVTVDEVPPDAGLKPGFTGEVKILIGNVPEVLLVPVQAVGQKNGQHRCYVVNARTIEPREITIGENNDKFVVVTEGLAEGEKVVLDARARIAAELKASGEKLPSSKDTEKTPGPAAAPGR